ncbi:KRAB [Mytilus coruscus]|uniref:KRAB n=1 Tax=Mytilus coruscus TaxID=42192 RepID=A0A6J8EIQ9_MYTCO|nr:KRAB [Mytilus coruscus]
MTQENGFGFTGMKYGDRENVGGSEKMFSDKFSSLNFSQYDTDSWKSEESSRSHWYQSPVLDNGNNTGISSSEKNYKNGSILNVPNVKCNVTFSRNMVSNGISKLNRNFHQSDELQKQTSEGILDPITSVTSEYEQIPLFEQGSINHGETSNNRNSPSHNQGNEIKQKTFTSRRKSTIPKRRPQQITSKCDEDLLEREVKKYLLKIPSWKTVLPNTDSDKTEKSNSIIDSYKTEKSNSITESVDADVQDVSESYADISENKSSVDTYSDIGIIQEHENSDSEKTEEDIQKQPMHGNLLNIPSYTNTVKEYKTDNDFDAKSRNKTKTYKPKDRVICKLCGKSFGRPSELRRHSVIHTGERNHKCEECEKVFTQRYHLIRHVKNVHKKELENLVCGICNETFNSEYLLKRHVTRHGVMTYACEVCRKEFKTKRQMKEHILSLHAGVKPFKCDQCDKMFTRKYHLERHLMMHAGTKDYQCKYCGKEFSTKGNLLSHVRRVHLQIKEYTCGVCQKGFFSPKDLQTHFKTHTGEKPYQCDICLKKFTEKSNMEWHLRIHSGERPYQCEYCEKTYTRMPHLLRHRKEGLCALRALRFKNSKMESKLNDMIMDQVEKENCLTSRDQNSEVTSDSDIENIYTAEKITDNEESNAELSSMVKHNNSKSNETDSESTYDEDSSDEDMDVNCDYSMENKSFFENEETD